MPEVSALDEAVRLLEHRGPDDVGTWTSERAALGFRRLSIQDLSSNGHQPMLSGDGRYVTVFNGEIYNFKVLRKELCDKGFTFRTGTDTEVLLTLFQHEGPRCLRRLNGMFAVAIHDTRDGSLFLARDRFGEKPLYMLQDRRGFVFASELKALRPFASRMGMTWDLNTDRLFEYMAFRYVSGEDTLVRGVVKLAQGSWLRIEAKGASRCGQFYDLAAVDGGGRRRGGRKTEAEHVDEVHDLLQDSIRLRMISDAPIGVALSGGVDSSLVTGLMREVHNGRIDTFSVAFHEKQIDGRTIDESAYSDFVARKFGTTHHRMTLDEGLFAKLYPTCLWHNDEPLNFPHSMGIYLLARFASQRVKVLLCGEGADEAFAGYTYFRQPRLDHRKHRFVRFSDVRTLLHRGVPQDLSTRQRAIEKCPEGVNGEIHFSLRTYLTTIENRLDKMSMANGLEMRLPFLDQRVVERSLRLPDALKVKGQTTKYLLKKLAERYVPHAQIYRPKVGFSTPLNQWLRNRKLLGQYVDILAEERTLNRPIYNRTEILALLRNFWKGPDTFRYSYAGRVWVLMNLELWIRMFLEGDRV